MARKNPHDDEPNENQDFNESDDTFGLPEIEYEPLNREQEVEETPEAEPTNEHSWNTEETYDTSASSETYEDTNEPVEPYDEPPPLEEANPDYQYDYEEEESSPVWPKALLIVLIILLALGGGGWYFFYYKPQQDEIARREAEAKERANEAAMKEQARRDSIAQVQADYEQHMRDSLAKINELTPAAGTIETLSSRTGRYHVVVASDIDDDLLMDFAKRLSAKGISSRIIPPFGNVKFFRLTIADGDSFGEAQSKANELKPEYGDGLWVMKY